MSRLLSLRLVRLSAFGILIVLNLLMGVFLYRQLDGLMAKISGPVGRERPLLSEVLTLQRLTSSLDLSLHPLLTGQSTDIGTSQAIISQIMDRVNAMQIKHLATGDEEAHLASYRKSLKRLKVALVYYRDNADYDAAGSATEALYEIINSTIIEVSSHLNALISGLRQRIADTDLGVLDGVHFLRNVIAVIFAVAVCGSLLVLFAFNLVLNVNFKELIKAAMRLGQGDLEWRVESPHDDEFGTLSRAFNGMADQLARSRSELEAQTRKIENLAYNDILTGLPNRVTFIDRLTQEIERAGRSDEKLAILFIDLDDFKLANDMYGHDVGDELLRRVGERMRRHTRLSDTVARLGGDEFTILLTQQSTSRSSTYISKRIIDEIKRPYKLTHRILSELNRPFRINDNEVIISSTIGIAVYPDNGTTVEEILKNADMAMYAAKKRGKNSFMFCSREMTERMDALLRLEQDLKAAIKSGDQFFVQYQPQVAIDDGRLVGFEALVRWRHPQKGLIPPVDFISLAEERGLIYEISKVVVGLVCRRLRQWLEAGVKALPVMVNLSARDFFLRDVESFIVSRLEEERVPPGLIGIEVTESSVMRDLDKAVAILHAFRKMGVKIALDDFGTGYSSLNYLKALPIDVVKIDRSFVSEIETDKRNRAITSAIVSMAHALDLSVLAEGIETESQRAVLIDLECDSAQGFLFSKPLSEDEATRLLTS